MDYSQRMHLIASELNEFLRRFKRPDHLDNDQAMLEIKATCTAINKRMQSGLDRVAVLDRLRDAFQDVCENFRGTGWPKTAVFVTSMESINRHKAPVEVKSAQGGLVVDPIAIACRRMNAGELVGDDWIYGRRCHELMASGEVSQDTLRKYRSAIYFSFKDVWGEDTARRLEAEMIARHEAAAVTFAGDKRLKAPTYMPKTFGGAS